jgi:alpha-L-rhamnosidase
MKRFQKTGMIILVLVVTAAICLSSLVVKAFGGVAVTANSLKTEYAVNPLGIDCAQPRLSWTLETVVTGRRSQSQTAYQVLVASSAANLAVNNGDQWDNGKVLTDRSVNVIYNGAAVTTGKRYYWKVRVWDESDQVSDWSTAAWWEMGLLQTADWQQAKWISIRSASPISIPRLAADWTNYTFEADFSIQQSYAGFVFRDGGFWWQVANGNPGRLRAYDSAGSALLKDIAIYKAINTGTIYHFKVEIAGTLIKTYLDGVLVDTTTNGNNPKGTIGLRCESGARSLFDNILVKDSGNNVMFQDDCNDNAVNNFQWAVSANGNLDIHDGKYMLDAKTGLAAPLVRKKFQISKSISQARAYICGLGYYELFINGQRIGDNVLDPGYTNYSKRLLYTTYDVTGNLQQNTNAVGVMLGRGWYGITTPNVWNDYRAPWNSEPKAIIRLNIQFTDGTSTDIISDGSWKAAEGPVVFDSIRAGEIYDARKEKSGWETSGYDDTGWDNGQEVSGPQGILAAQTIQPVKAVDTLTPVSVSNPKAGVYVYDLGRNIAGWCRLTVSGPAGTNIVLKHGQRLNGDGTVNVDELRGNIDYGAYQRDAYILKGTGTETWEAHFSYKGFRYVELNGFPGTPNTSNLAGRVAHSAVDAIGTFTSSNTLINQVYTLTQRSILNNLYSIPTDCPHLEKNGWTCEDHLLAEMSMYSFDMERMFEKRLNDFLDDQGVDGTLQCVVPSAWGDRNTDPAWEGSYILIAWYLYQFHGDPGILQKHYDGMKKYVDRLTQTAISSGYILNGWYGDWSSPGNMNPPEGAQLTSTAYYYYYVQIMSQVANLLGKSTDAATFSTLANTIKTAFNDRFFDADNEKYRVGGEGYRQTSNVFPLFLGIVPDGHENSVAINLVNDIIQTRGNHLNVGILGLKYLPKVLADRDFTDITYNMFEKTDQPSHGFMSALGATTLWEQWGTDARSLDHKMYGTIGDWMYRNVAGLDLDPFNPGFKHIIIKPLPGNGVSSARAEYGSDYGRIISDWNLNGDLTLNVTIPVNTTAKVQIPKSSYTNITIKEGSITIWNNGTYTGGAAGVSYAGETAGFINFDVGSGVYSFIRSGVFRTPTPIPSPSPTPSPNPNTKIVDDDDSGSSFTGAWTRQTDLNDKYAASYRYAASGNGSIYGTFTPNLAVSGNYNVYAWWTQQANRASNTPFTIYYNGGNQTVTKDQRTGGGHWNLLGTYNFTSGTVGYVKITNNADGYVIADAVKFIPADGGATPTPAPTPTATATPAGSTATPLPAGTNRALNQTVTSSSTVEASGWGQIKVVDGQRSTIPGSSCGWSSNDSLISNHTEWVKADLVNTYTIVRVDIYPRNDGVDTGENIPIDFTIQLSADNTNWTTAVTQTGYPKPGNTVQSFPISNLNARYVKIEGTNLRPNPNDANRYRMAFAEIEIFDAAGGTVTPTPTPTPAPTATPVANTVSYTGTDTGTQGSWKTVYGVDGYDIRQSGTSLPSYASLTYSGGTDYTWASSTTDVKGLQKPNPATDRILACRYSDTYETIDMTISGGTARNVVIYLLDYDNGGTGRVMTAEVMDGDSGTILDTRSVSNFTNGIYLKYSVKGHIKFKFTKTTGFNTVFSGVFFN